MALRFVERKRSRGGHATRWLFPSVDLLVPQQARRRVGERNQRRVNGPGTLSNVFGKKAPVDQLRSTQRRDRASRWWGREQIALIIQVITAVTGKCRAR